MTPTQSRRGIRPSIFFGILFITAFSGCKSDVPEGTLIVHPVQGTVTVKGKPAEGILVMIAPAEGSIAAKEHLQPSGTTDAEGRFSLSTYITADGAPVGQYSVLLQWPTIPATGKKMPLGFVKTVDQFKGKYMNPATSHWQITVKEGDNVLDPIAVN